jgi:uncharacterized protein
MSRYAKLAYTHTVRAAQAENGVLHARRLGSDEGPDPLGPREAAFIRSRDGFYLATRSETGWPYVQYRGGPPGFLHVVDDQTLAFADVRGNRQYITTGNLQADDRVSLFLMDYARQARLKLFGHATVVGVSDHPDLAANLTSVRTDGNVERLVMIRVEGINWNCSQHITPRFTEQELAQALESVDRRMAGLEAENLALRTQLEEYRAGSRSEGSREPQ